MTMLDWPVTHKWHQYNNRTKKIDMYLRTPLSLSKTASDDTVWLIER